MLPIDASVRAGRLPAWLLVALVAMSCGCGDDHPAAPASVVSIAASATDVVLPAIPARFRITVTATLDNGEQRDVTRSGRTGYRSLDPTIAGVGGGEISAASEGTTLVIVSHEGAADSVTVRVDETAEIALESLGVEPDTLSLLIDEVLVVGATASWSNGASLAGAGLPFTYRSADATVVRVGPNGNATGVGAGSASLAIGFRQLQVDLPVTVAGGRFWDFSRDVLPILQAGCTDSRCHSGNAATPAQRGLRLNSYDELIAGGINGPVVAPGRGAESRLIRALRGTLPRTLPMPLEGALSGERIEIIEEWIDQGACRAPGDCPAKGRKR